MENNSARVENSISLIFVMVDRLGHDKNYWIVFFGKILSHFKEICKLPNSV